MREIAAVKERIENEVVGGEELERNVKLGRGGIREIEFLVQSLQVLHAGTAAVSANRANAVRASPSSPNTTCCRTRRRGNWTTAYRFLRDVEHRLQMEENRQTHTIPADRPARLRLARLMNFPAPEEFESALRDTHRQRPADL